MINETGTYRYVAPIFGVFLAVSLVLSSSDFGIYLFGKYLFVLLLTITLFLTVKHLKDRALTVFVLYFSAVSILAVINIYVRSRFNFVAFSPVVAFLMYLALQPKPKYYALKSVDLVCLLIVPALMAVELAAKVRQEDIAMMGELIQNTGAGRFDVLRLQVPFGSPLSLASLFLAASLVYLLFYRSFWRASIILALSLMTGTRTVVFLILIVFSVTVVIEYVGDRDVSRQRLWNDFRALLVPVVLSVVVFLIPPYGASSVWIATIGRIFAPSSFVVTQDASFMGRGETTGYGLVEVFQKPDSMIFFGGENILPSDSALLSIAQQSGILSAILLFGMFILLIICTEISVFRKLVLLFAFIVAALMMGDAIVPPAALIYLVTFISFGAKKFATK